MTTPVCLRIHPWSATGGVRVWRFYFSIKHPLSSVTSTENNNNPRRHPTGTLRTLTGGLHPTSEAYTPHPQTPYWVTHSPSLGEWCIPYIGPPMHLMLWCFQPQNYSNQWCRWNYFYRSTKLLPMYIVHRILLFSPLLLNGKFNCT